MKGIEFIRKAEIPRNMHAINSNKINVKLILEGSVSCSRIRGSNLIMRKNAPIRPRISLSNSLIFFFLIETSYSFF